MAADNRRFTDEEFALVLRKAMALQEDAHQGRRSLPTGDLSLEDMKAVAREVGIDPALVERAVALLPAGGTTGIYRLLGGPTRYRLEHSGRRLLEREDLAEMLDVIRREMQHPGKVTTELDGVVWETEGEVSQFHLSLSPRGESTEVRLTVNRDGAFILTWFLSLVGGMVVAGATGAILDPHSALGTVTILAAGAGGGLTLARTLWGRTTRSIKAKINRLMDAVVRQVDGPEGDDSE